MSRYKDLTGMRIGKLTVIKLIDTTNDKRHRKIWLCKCDCGNKKKILGESLTSNTRPTLSCGCLKSEVNRKKFKQYNTYDLTGEYGVGFTNKGEKFYFDLKDYDKIKDMYWHVSVNGYMVNVTNNRTTFMHRVIMNTPKELITDHINHHTVDNRKINLRVCSVSQNSMNTKWRNDNKSGKLGVWFDNKANKWASSIICNGENIWLGYHENKEIAIKVRNIAEISLFGDFRYNPNAPKINDNL